MTEAEMFEYAMLAWVALMIGTLLTVAWHLTSPAQCGTHPQGGDAKLAPGESLSDAVREADAPPPTPEAL